jgi:serine/threonine protein kinase/Tol biopolymer transport system component
MIGQVFSHYRVLERLGGGGMGVVFLAEDTKLGRRVALKFLSETLTAPANLERFTREARAASALNHPNICTIYEIDEADGKPFIAMELLEGRNLHEELSSQAFSIEKILDLAIQLADGLDAAHAKGIVHRDIKPANLFLNPRGQLKILDFGLAKLSTADGDSVGSGETVGMTDTGNLTSPGTAIGTIAYMSPEQARGEDIDARSDLFSAGSVLYELVSLRLPFPGKTSAVVFDAILNREPLPLLEFNPRTPDELQRIIGKSLEKDRDVRFQSAAELRADLKRLKRDSASGRMQVAGSSGTGAIPTAKEGTSTAAAVISTGSAAAPARTSGFTPASSSALVEAAKQHRLGLGVAGFVTLAVMAIAAFGVYALFRKPIRTPFSDYAVVPVTSSGDSSGGAISPDAKYVAFLRSEPDGKKGIWVRHLATGSESSIVGATEDILVDVVFGPESNYVYYRQQVRGKTVVDLYRVPFLGGKPEFLSHDIDSPPSFSPDGKRFCFERENAPQAGKSQVLIADADGQNETEVATGDIHDFYRMSWSPDGKRLAFSRQQHPGPGFHLMTLDLQTRTPRLLAPMPSQSYEPQQIVWGADGKGLLVVYREIDNGKFQIAYAGFPDGKFHKVTNDLNRYLNLSLSADGKTLASTTMQNDSSVQVFASDGVIDDTHAILSHATGHSGVLVDWLDNQHVLSFENSTGIRSVTVPSGESTVLYRDEPVHSYDGRNCAGNGIAFTGVDPRKDASASEIYEISLSGANLRQITASKQNQFMRCTADGKTVVHFNFADGTVRKTPREGGTSTILVPASLRPSPSFDVTADGKYAVVPVREGSEAKMAFVSVETGKIERETPGVYSAGDISLTPDGKSFSYISFGKNIKNLWVQSFAGGAPRQLSNYGQSAGPTKSISAFAWSPDGKHLAVVRTTSRLDVILMRDQQ